LLLIYSSLAKQFPKRGIRQKRGRDITNEASNAARRGIFVATPRPNFPSSVGAAYSPADVAPTELNTVFITILHRCRADGALVANRPAPNQTKAPAGGSTPKRSAPAKRRCQCAASWTAAALRRFFPAAKGGFGGSKRLFTRFLGFGGGFTVCRNG
jgi:hypothetical protein